MAITDHQTFQARIRSCTITLNYIVL